MTGVVIDTNVVVSANLSDEGLPALVVSLALSGSLPFFISAPIVQEYERVLSYPRLKFLPEDIDPFMRLVRLKGLMTPAPKRRLNVATHEPDNRFLECAEVAKADYLVTGNKRHFPTRWKTTKVVSVRELLNELIERKA